MDFTEYTATLDYLVTVGLPRDERVRAAWTAGGGRGPVPQPLTPGPYLFDQLREAFRRGGE